MSVHLQHVHRTFPSIFGSDKLIKICHGKELSLQSLFRRSFLIDNQSYKLNNHLSVYNHFTAYYSSAVYVLTLSAVELSKLLSPICVSPMSCVPFFLICYLEHLQYPISALQHVREHLQTHKLLFLCWTKVSKLLLLEKSFGKL